MKQPEEWAIKQHLEKNPKCEWLCTHINLENLGETQPTPTTKHQTDTNFYGKGEIESMYERSMSDTKPLDERVIEQVKREGCATVQSGDYSIPKHKNWIEINGKYLVDFNDVVANAEKQARIDELNWICRQIELAHGEPSEKITDRIKELEQS